MADGRRQGIRRVVRGWRLRQAEDRTDHPLHLRFLCATEATDGGLDLRNGVLGHGDVAKTGGGQHGAARLPDLQGTAGVAADVDALDREGRGRVLLDQRVDGTRDRGQALLERRVRIRVDASESDRPKPAAYRCHHAEARGCRAGVDPEDHHERSLRAGAVAPPPSDSRTMLPMAARPPRHIAFIERHPRWWPDADAAEQELLRVTGDGTPFLLVDHEGEWEAVCVEVAAELPAARWIETRTLPAGEWAVSEVGGRAAERLITRDDRRPAWLVRAEEAPTGENEYEPGGETFGLSTRLGEHAGLRRIGVNVDLIRPGERSTKFHWHHEEEECFLVLSGSGVLMVGDERFRVGPGDFFAKREGPERPHQFVNDGDQDLRILTIGEHRGDKAEYPVAPWQSGDAAPSV